MSLQNILVTILALWLVVVTARSMYRDVRTKDWNSLAVHSVHMTCIGLALTLAIPYLS